VTGDKKTAYRIALLFVPPTTFFRVIKIKDNEMCEAWGRRKQYRVLVERLL
jgi:hypothetical protein